VTGSRIDHDDQGETLVEVLVAVVILGLAGVAVLAGMALAAKASDIHRKETTGGAQVRTWAEDIQSYVTNDPTKYAGCATQSTAYLGPAVSFATPSAFKTPSYTVQSIIQNATGQVTNVACGSDVGLQLITLTLASTDAKATEKLTFILRRPCDPNSAVCP
jgi:hypothetical protein